MATMAADAIVFALANPDPEVAPRGRAPVRPRRGHRPLGLPEPDQQRARVPRHLPRRLRRAGATAITEGMKLAAASALAGAGRRRPARGPRSSPRRSTPASARRRRRGRRRRAPRRRRAADRRPCRAGRSPLNRCMVSTVARVGACSPSTPHEFSSDDPRLGPRGRASVPNPVAPDGLDARSSVKAASLNHHDLWSLRGVGLSRSALPMILGCDARRASTRTATRSSCTR